MALRYALILTAALALASSADAQRDPPFRDDFDGTSLDPRWEVAEGSWRVEGGLARNLGVGPVDYFTISQPYNTVFYEIEARFDLADGVGSFLFGGEAFGGYDAYGITYRRETRGGPPVLRLSRAFGGELTGLIDLPLGGAILAPIPTPLGGESVGVLVRRDGFSGVIEVYVDQGVGFGQKPAIRVLDQTHIDLGFFGVYVDNERNRGGGLVDYIEVRGGQPIPALVTDVVAASGADYPRGFLSGDTYATPATYPDERLYVDRPTSTHRIAGVPFELEGAAVIRTANDDKRATAQNVLRFTLAEAATVYVGYDPRATALPAWLQGWTRTGDVVHVVDPEIGYLDLYKKDFDAGRVTLGGNLAAPAAGAESNYLVAAAVGTPYISQRADAASAELAGPRAARDQPFFTGAGFADYLAPSGDAVEWTVFASQSYRHTLGFRYALVDGNRPLEIRVNGEVVAPALAFPSTGGWDRWATARLVVQLEPGLNTVTATAVGQSGPNVDALLLDDPNLVGQSAASTPRVALARAPEAPSFALDAAAPNPTAGPARITFALPEAGPVRLAVYDVLGREVARLVDGELGAGRHVAALDGAALPGGTYLYRLDAGGRTLVRQLTVVR